MGLGWEEEDAYGDPTTVFDGDVEREVTERGIGAEQLTGDGPTVDDDFGRHIAAV